MRFREIAAMLVVEGALRPLRAKYLIDEKAIRNVNDARARIDRVRPACNRNPCAAPRRLVYCFSRSLAILSQARTMFSASLDISRLCLLQYWCPCEVSLQIMTWLMLWESR